VKDEVVFYLRGVPKLSRDQFKAACAKRGKNMREVAIALFQLFAETVDVSVFVPGEERKWLEKILKRIEQNRRGKKKLRDERSELRLIYRWEIVRYDTLTQAWDVARRILQEGVERNFVVLSTKVIMAFLTTPASEV
jgi:hypothetical protein